MRLEIDKMRSSGFTLVELLVSVFIISLVFALGYANFRQYSQRQEHIALVRQIEEDLLLARNFADSGKKPSSCSSLDGYKFVWDADEAEYSIYAVCGGSQAHTAEISNKIDKDNYELSITHNNFMFKTLGSGTDLPGDCTITLTQKRLNRALSIKISRSGEIITSE